MKTSPRERSVYTSITAADIEDKESVVWSDITAHLSDEGISEETIAEERGMIAEWMEENLPLKDPFADNDEGVSDEEEEHEENLRRLGRLAISSEERHLSIPQDPGLLGGSPYLPGLARSENEDIHDEVLDEMVAKDIESAVNHEASLRLIESEARPYGGPLPWGWVWDARAKQFKNIYTSDVLAATSTPTLEPWSFTAMAYQTAPRCIKEIDRLDNLIAQSGITEGVGTDFSNQEAEEAVRSLRLVRLAAAKFGFLQDQRRDSNPRFSDLDAFVVMASVLDDCNPQHTVLKDYPHGPAIDVQTGYPEVLKLIMGFVHAITQIYTGRTYLTRPREESDRLWNEQRMYARMKQIERKLHKWDAIEIAGNKCREWFLNNHVQIERSVRHCLWTWREARSIRKGLYGDTIRITRISANGLPPGGRFSSKKFWITVQNTYPQTRYLKTSVCESQDPQWEESCEIELKGKPGYFSVTLWSKSYSGSTMIGSHTFTYLPAKIAEPMMGNATLLYSYNGRLDLHSTCLLS